MSAMHVSCLGAGRMSRGIALAFALKGHSVGLLDVKARSQEEARATREAAFAEMATDLAAFAEAGEDLARDAATVLSRVGYVRPDGARAELAQASVLFEGVPEVLDVKRAAFNTIAADLPPRLIIASTSSTFLSTELAAMVGNPGRCLNAHWLNPAYLIPLVEVSPHPQTDPAVTDALIAILERIGKAPVRCGVSPGYIVPRLQSLVMNEAARMIEEGVATPADIDRATRFGFGPRFAGMGVIEFIDFGGNDILYHASRYLARELGDARYASPAIVERHMTDRLNGMRDGKGFYDWSSIDPAAYRASLLKRLRALIEAGSRGNGLEAAREPQRKRTSD